MQPIIGIFDDFLLKPDESIASVLAGPYEDYHSPVDGVVYPAINKEVPDDLGLEMIQKLAFLMRRELRDLDVVTLFSRAMFHGMSAPNKIHSDVIMGRYAAHLYLSKDWPEGAGTSFWRHREQGATHTDRTKLELMDHNDLSQWERVVTVQGKRNRLLIHHADHWHLAEPIGGWGGSPGDARVVITCFFN